MSQAPPHKLFAFVATLGLATSGLAFSALAARTADDRAFATEVLAQQSASSSPSSFFPSSPSSSSPSSASAGPASSSRSSRSPAAAASHALSQTRRALERADQAKAAGDAVTASYLEGLAREWAEMAQDIIRASTAENHADRAQLAAASASANVRKAQAMLETLAGRRSRAEGELQEVRDASSASIPSAALSAARLRLPPSPPTPQASQ